MAATFNIQKPYVLTTLPRPLSHEANGSAYVVGDVWGQQQGSKKRKRPELALGVDGEAVNLYDVCPILLPSILFSADQEFCLGTLLEADHFLPDPAPICLHLPTMLHKMEGSKEQRCFALHIYLDTWTEAEYKAFQGRAGSFWGYHLDDCV